MKKLLLSLIALGLVNMSMAAGVGGNGGGHHNPNGTNSKQHSGGHRILNS